MPKSYPSEVRERAVRMALDRLADYPSIVAFLIRMKEDGHGVELTCRVLREQGVQVTSRSYRAWRTRAASARTRSDAVILDTLKSLSIRDAKGRRRPEILYGRRKMTAWLARSVSAKRHHL